MYYYLYLKSIREIDYALHTNLALNTDICFYKQIQNLREKRILPVNLAILEK